MYQSNQPRPEDRPSAPSRRRTRTNVVELNHISQLTPKVSPIPQARPIPAWLRSLFTIQHSTGLLFGSVFTLSIIVYGYTVYTQGIWKHQHGQLKRLQAQERQQGVMDENLKNQLATSAELPESGLVAPDPKKILFIPSAASRPTKPASAPAQSSTPAPKAPLGY